MAERLNAHDSKSCYAGMYTRVQIPFSAPGNERLVAFCYKPFLLQKSPNTILTNIRYSATHAYRVRIIMTFLFIRFTIFQP